MLQVCTGGCCPIYSTACIPLQGAPVKIGLGRADSAQGNDGGVGGTLCHSETLHFFYVFKAELSKQS